ncbi:MAG: TSUP family transporter [Alphaproteobacteria bacterium]|nr:TSUP family transporter [Alphaproteobacteria bacterium]
MIETGETTGDLPKNTIVFCKRPWKLPVAVMAVLVSLTFAWGAYVMNTYEEDDLFSGDDMTVTQFLFRSVAQPDVRRLYYSVPPAVVGVSGGGVNAVVQGSGALVGANGYVLTTLHTVANLPQIEIHVSTGRGVQRFPAQIVKTEPAHDLALLKMMSPERFLHFRLAPTQGMAVGQPVFAFGQGMRGNPVIRQGGLIATDAPLSSGGMTISHLLRTDAVYSWEQNGGPLVNAQGELVGINIAVKGPSGGIEGFAIPAHIALAHFQDVLKFKMGGRAVAPQGTNQQAVGMAQQNAAAPQAVPAAAGAAGWWSKAKAQVGGQAPAPGYGVNVALPTAGGIGLINAPNGGQLLFDRDHSGGLRIAGYPLSDVFGLALLALAAGITGGMMTMGGGVLQVAGMMAFFGYGMYLIRPVAFLTNVAVYGAASLRNSKAGLVEWDKVKKLAPWGVAGVVLGYFLGNAMGDGSIAILLGVFAMAMAMKAVHEIAYADRAPGTKADALDAFIGDDAPDQKTGEAEAKPAIDIPEGHLRSAVLGLPMGLVSGILGISGGVIEVPLQRYIGRTSLQNAIANSSVLVFWASVAGTLVSFTHGISRGLIDWQAPIVLALLMIPGAYAGGILGAKLMRALPVVTLKSIYAVIMAAIAVKMLFAS